MHMTLAREKSPHGHIGDIVYPSELIHAAIRFFVEAAKPDNLSIGVSSGVMPFAFFGIRWRRAAAPFCDHVGSIVFRRTQEQVRRIDARRMIAFMQAIQASRDWAVMQFVRTAMCLCKTTIHLDYPVSMLIMGGFPIPAFVRAALIDFAPKSFSHGPDDAPPIGVAHDKAHGFALDMTLAGIGTLRDWCELTATAMAVAIRNMVRGMIGVHENLHFSCQAWDC